MDDNGIPDKDRAIYGLQRILVDGEKYLVFYDSGASDLVTKYSAIKRLKERAIEEYAGQIELGGVGDIKTKTDYGIHRIRIPMHDGKNASMSGVCLEKITEKFPTFPLSTRVKKDVEDAYQKCGGNITDLPGLPKEIGGEVDIMIGSRYLRYSPKEIIQLPSGLTIYESKFVNADGGGRGVVCGPHPVFNMIGQQSNITFMSYVSAI